MTTGLFAVVPKPFKRVIRRAVLDPVLRRMRDVRLRRSIDAFRSSPMPTAELVRDLRHAWGNESFSADVSYVTKAMSLAKRCANPILECGSGLTTVALALVAAKRGVVVWSLEQDKDWAEIVRSQLRRNGIGNVELRYAPLHDYGGYVWYDVRNVDFPSIFDLVVCDGPAVFETWGNSHPQWRYGVLPVLTMKGVNVGDVLLDDVTDTRAANLLARWRLEFGRDSQLIRESDGDYAIVSRAI